MNLNSADKDPDPASAPDPAPAPASDPNTASDTLGDDIVNNSGEQRPVAEPKVISHYIELGFY